MFLQLNMSLSPAYDEVLSRLKNEQRLLDLGCCFGQDIRKLVHDGVPSENRTWPSHSQDFLLHTHIGLSKMISGIHNLSYTVPWDSTLG